MLYPDTANSFFSPVSAPFETDQAGCRQLLAIYGKKQKAEEGESKEPNV